jgi:hypothetical protein
VCISHYPVDQLKLIRELDDIREVKLDISTGSLTFIDNIDSTKMSHICSILARGLRLHRIDLSSLESSASALKQFTKTLIRASIVDICFFRYLSDETTDSEKLQIENVLALCNEIIASNRRVKYVTMQVNDIYSRKTVGIVDALRSNGTLHTLSYGLATTSEDMSQIISALEKSQVLTTLELKKHIQCIYFLGHSYVPHFLSSFFLFLYFADSNNILFFFRNKVYFNKKENVSFFIIIIKNFF